MNHITQLTPIRYFLFAGLLVLCSNNSFFFCPNASFTLHLDHTHAHREREKTNWFDVLYMRTHEPARQICWMFIWLQSKQRQTHTPFLFLTLAIDFDTPISIDTFTTQVQFERCRVHATAERHTHTHSHTQSLFAHNVFGTQPADDVLLQYMGWHAAFYTHSQQTPVWSS